MAAHIGDPDTILVPVEEVHENAWNPNVVPEHIMAALVANVDRAGFNQPILVRKVGDGYEVVDGAHRLRAAKAHGHTYVPVIVREFTDAEAKAQTLAMNKLRGEMEPADVARLVREIAEDGISLDELSTHTGYQLEELQALDTLLDFDWDASFGGEQETPPADPGQDDEWVTLSFRVPDSVATLVRAELDRVKHLLETEHDHIALEALIANSAASGAEAYT